MTDWVDVRAALTAETSGALGWHVDQARFFTEPGCVDAKLCRLSVVSSVDEGERAEITDPNTLEVTFLQDTRAQVQFMFESEVGEEAHDHARTCRAHFKKSSTKERLAALGIAVVMEPAPVANTPYLHDGYWVSACSFELPIRFNNLITDEDADPKPAASVGYTGTAGGVTIPPTVVTEP